MSGHSDWVAGMLGYVSLAAGVLILISLALAFAHKSIYLRAPLAGKILVEALAVFICFCAFALAATLVYSIAYLPA